VRVCVCVCVCVCVFTWFYSWRACMYGTHLCVNLYMCTCACTYVLVCLIDTQGTFWRINVCLPVMSQRSPTPGFFTLQNALLNLEFRGHPLGRLLESKSEGKEQSLRHFKVFITKSPGLEEQFYSVS
jgi:hypothetical protein